MPRTEFVTFRLDTIGVAFGTIIFAIEGIGQVPAVHDYMK